MKPLSRRLLSGAAFGLIAALSPLGAPPAGAVGRRLDLATMTGRAGTIVSGRIVALRTGPHPKYHNIGVLYVTMQVDEMMKGAPSQQYTFMQFTGRLMPGDEGKGLSSAQSIPDMPAYRVGEEVVLFLYPSSSVGFTSPVGGEQGKFLIRRQEGQPTTVISEGGNQELAVSGPLPSRLKPNQQNLLRHPGDRLDFQTFRATVKALAVGAK